MFFSKLRVNYLVLLITFTFLSACGGGGGSSTEDEPNQPPTANQATKNITLNVLNVDGSAITQNVAISFTGTEVTDTSDTAITSATFPATRNIRAKIDADASVDLNILAKSNNFVDSGITLQLNPDNDDYSAIIY